MYLGVRFGSRMFGYFFDAGMKACDFTKEQQVLVATVASSYIVVVVVYTSSTSR